MGRNESLPETVDSRHPIYIARNKYSISELNLASGKRLSPSLKPFKNCITMFQCDPTLHNTLMSGHNKMLTCGRIHA